MLQRIAQHPLEFYRPVAEAAQEVVTQVGVVETLRVQYDCAIHVQGCGL
jgi:ribosomal protein S9